MPTYAVAHADIAHQRVEDEVIVINLVTGAYFSLRGAAADGWDLLIAGAPADQVAAALADRYAIDSAVVATDLDPFVAKLLAEDLIRVGPIGVHGVDLPPVQLGAPYQQLSLDKFDDMEELLLLDPIHEVDEAGWPIVASEPET